MFKTFRTSHRLTMICLLLVTVLIPGVDTRPANPNAIAVTHR